MIASVRIDKESLAEIDELAKLTQRSRSFFIKTAIDCFLRDYKDIYEAGQIVENMKLGKEETISAEELRKEYGLDA